MTWIRRNVGPITGVLLAAALVIGAFELIDLLIGNGASDSAEESETTLAGIAAFAGLIKVTLFLAVPFMVTLLVRRWTTNTSTS